jgi:hypothetical protein
MRFRDEKIERERREKELKDLAECSFAPSIGKESDNGKMPTKREPHSKF